MSRASSIIDLTPFLNRRVRIRVQDREVSGVLKAFDRIPNIVLDEAREESCGGRALGVTIVRGQMMTSVLPDDLQPVENPFG